MGSTSPSPRSRGCSRCRPWALPGWCRASPRTAAQLACQPQTRSCSSCLPQIRSSRAAALVTQHPCSAQFASSPRRRPRSLAATPGPSTRSPSWPGSACRGSRRLPRARRSTDRPRRRCVPTCSGRRSPRTPSLSSPPSTGRPPWALSAPRSRRRWAPCAPWGPGCSPGPSRFSSWSRTQPRSRRQGPRPGRQRPSRIQRGRTWMRRRRRTRTSRAFSPECSGPSRPRIRAS
mmetsp:Transcript_92572/g.241182  ORF Transcript_92572/g.241182 Transcript_92572/m.241182 type:complete len:232 (+) Transcript_92572:911-1606(+)